MVKFKDFSRSLHALQVLLKANFIFKGFSRVLYIQVLFKPVQTLHDCEKKVQRGSYMNAHVLLTLLHELEKSDKM